MASGRTSWPENRNASGMPGSPSGRTPENRGPTSSTPVNAPERVSRPKMTLGPAPPPRSPGRTSTEPTLPTSPTISRALAPVPKTASGIPPRSGRASSTGSWSRGHDHRCSVENPSEVMNPGPCGQAHGPCGEGITDVRWSRRRAGRPETSSGPRRSARRSRTPPAGPPRRAVRPSRRRPWGPGNKGRGR